MWTRDDEFKRAGPKPMEYKSQLRSAIKITRY